MIIRQHYLCKMRQNTRMGIVVQFLFLLISHGAIIGGKGQDVETSQSLTTQNQVANQVENGGNNSHVAPILVFFLTTVPALIALGVVAFKYWKLRKQVIQDQQNKTDPPESNPLMSPEIIFNENGEGIKTTEPESTSLEMPELLPENNEEQQQGSESQYSDVEEKKDLPVVWPGPVTFWDQGTICKINLIISGMEIKPNPVEPMNAELMGDDVFQSRSVHFRIKLHKESGDVIYEYKKDLPAEIRAEESYINFGFQSVILTLKKCDERISWKQFEDLLIEDN